MDELVEETGYSKSTVSANMATLERHGLAKRLIVPSTTIFLLLTQTH